MDGTIHLNRDFGLKEGGDFAAALKAAEVEVRSRDTRGRGRGGFGWPCAEVTCDNGEYVMADDVSLSGNGSRYRFPARIYLRRGATIWFRGTELDYSANWVPTLLFGMPEGRRSFRTWSGSDYCVLKNYDSMAALSYRDDWTGARGLTIDFSLGRNVDFTDEWHNIFAHEESTGSNSAPLRISAWRTTGSNARLQIEIRLQDGIHGERVIDRWVVHIPNFMAAFPRRDITLQYTTRGNLVAFVDRVRVIANRSSAVPAARFNQIADNRQLGPFTFGWNERLPGPSLDMTLHGFRLQTQAVYVTDTPIGSAARRIDGRTITDNVQFARWPLDIQGDGTAWSLEPDFDGRGFTSFARGRQDGFSKTRVFRYANPFQNTLDLADQLTLSDAAFIAEGFPDSSGPWATPVMFGWALNPCLENVRMPDGGFTLLNSYGISVYPVTIRQCQMHRSHTGIVSRFLSPCTVDGFHANYTGRAFARCVGGGGIHIKHLMGMAAGQETVACVVFDGNDTRSDITLDSIFWNNEGNYPGVPLIHANGRLPLDIDARTISLGHTSDGKRYPLIRLDRRGTPSMATSISLSHVSARDCDILQVDGAADNLSVRYNSDPALFEGVTSYPPDYAMSLISELSETVNSQLSSVKSGVSQLEAKFSELEQRISQAELDVPVAVQALENAKAELAVVQNIVEEMLVQHD
jgi:hypothetical protein